MRRRVVWAPEARRDLDQQIEYIAAAGVHAAQLVRNRIDATVEILAERPVGRPGRVPGTFEKLVLRSTYVIAYELPDDRQLHILRVIHTSRDWPHGEWPED
jgi:toxin ParE1/3/4